jgi:hypothetical protein
MTHKIYRCYFTDAADRIRSYEEIACINDSAAALKVDELLAASQYNSAELWQGKRLVGKWSVNGHAVEANGSDPLPIVHSPALLRR